jgi:SAM-dependent methyltransferase
VEFQSELTPELDQLDGAEATAFRALSLAEEVHFWHRSRNLYVSDRLAALGVHSPASVIELGCGGGCVSAHLARLGYSVTGIDNHRSRIVEAANRAPQARFVIHDLRLGNPKLESPCFDAVGLFDVIEHLDAPEETLRQALKLTKADGFLVGTVPALRGLWSQVDVDSGHRRRYEVPALRDLLESIPGGQIVEIAYFNRLLVPLLWLHRQRVSKDNGSSRAERNVKIPPMLLNGLLFRALRLEQRLRFLDATPLPGASLWFALRSNGK